MVHSFDKVCANRIDMSTFFQSTGIVAPENVRPVTGMWGKFFTALSYVNVKKMSIGIQQLAAFPLLLVTF